ncbi:MAG: tRNA pseudouridine(13) synthase TruD [Planctomycetota bacterium]|jgi:tRNA pseudouridine13 synthase
MKLKCCPEDFRVEELTDVVPSRGGYALYRLTKQSIGTLEVVSQIVDRLKTPRRQISYGGLKDRHAITSQYLTIQRGPQLSLNQSQFDLEYLGQVERHFATKDISGNRFELVLRDLSDDEVDAAVAAAGEVRRSGLANYYDDQRFGSLCESGEWVAKAWCLGDWERALWLALADPHPFDRATEKRQKEILREHWGRWVECKQALDKSHRRSVVTFLADKEAAGKPIDFRGAFGCLSIDLRGLYLSAWQSAVWNRILDRLLHDTVDESRLRELNLRAGTVALPTSMTDDETAALRDIELPFPSAKPRTDDEAALSLLDSVLQDEGFERRQLRIKHPKDSFFSKGLRPALVEVADLSASIDADDLHRDRRKLLLSFALPRGSYATMLVKRLTLSDKVV